MLDDFRHRRQFDLYTWSSQNAQEEPPNLIGLGFQKPVIWAALPDCDWRIVEENQRGEDNSEGGISKPVEYLGREYSWSILIAANTFYFAVDLSNTVGMRPNQ